MRWVIREIREWRVADDPKLQRLTALLVVTRYCDSTGGFWIAFPPGLENNAEFLATLSRLISGFRIAYSTQGLGQVPIWENEAAEKFKKADADGDWRALSEMWHLFAHTCFPNVLLVQVVQCMDRFAFPKLVEALARVRQTALAIQVAESLSVDRRLELALASDNRHMQFGAVMATFYYWPNRGVLSPQQQQLLTQLLSKVANDEPRWEQWMQAFNRYPQRYPAVQPSLGRALALGSDRAIEAYVNSIALSPTSLVGPRLPNGRGPVADCLRAFRAAAPIERRQALWGLAYQRWTKWDFGNAESTHGLTDIVGCELDYALVGYAVECMTKGEVDEARTSIFEEFVNLPKVWHESAVAFRTAMNRLFYYFQPYCHASMSPSAVDWLMEGRYYTPFDNKVDRYAALMCGIR
jgi:hypothetical protein